MLMNVMPTLLVLASTYPRWNGDHEPGFVHELAKRLTDRFHVIALVPNAPGALAHETLDGVEVIRYRYAPRRFETLVNDGGIVTNLRRQKWKALLVPAFVLAQAWQAWRLLRTRRIDVIHAHWLLPQGFILALLSKLSPRVPPWLVTSHGADLFALRGKGANILKRFVIRKAAAVTVVSEAMRDELKRIGADAGEVDVQPMGVDMTGKFTPEPGSGRSDDEILFVGRLVEKKGLRHLIDAMPAILSIRPAAFLTVVGFGPDGPARGAQVRHLGLQDKVHFTGALSQAGLPSMYRRAAVFVAPFIEAASGDREGLGLVAVEAAACGCPVVVSDLPTVPDAFVTTGLGAKMVPAGSATALSEAIVAILSDGARARSDAAGLIPSLKARFDWHVVAMSYASIFNRLMGQDSSRT